MRWKQEVYKSPKNGERRSVLKFAMIPELLDDGTKVWLEHFEAEQVYYETLGGVKLHPEQRWVTVCKKIAPQQESIST